MQVRRLRLVEGDAKRVRDHSGGDFVVAHQAGEDREPGCVGRRPAVRAECVRRQVEDRAVARLPAAALRGRVVHLIETTCIAIDGDDVTIAAALDRRTEWHRVRARIALGGVVDEVHGTVGSVPGTVTYGMPYAPPPPKSGWRFWLPFPKICVMYAFDPAATGADEMSAFQGLLGGNTVQAPSDPFWSPVCGGGGGGLGLTLVHALVAAMTSATPIAATTLRRGTAPVLARWDRLRATDPRS